ncbi:helix-turn-helix transcriptional regulator [Luteolibacter ambystomatis]|uniref:Helix-turn-helix transcriptional regulator n=1 Tax=Luteolibacter ambystomatis TaxID=2824561 RepID=A0A975G9F4_9BACT|nr:AraC family transcriptional regulator [Luteolibacter ambystomatis]QUE51155.1 helix-turn-helix transcriptional regulator [Luteolibacter ambystomatis]
MAREEWLDLENTPQRTIHDFRRRFGGSVVALGHYRYDRAMPPVPMQRSDSRLVIALLLSGMQHYRVDGGEHVLRGGQGLRLLPGVRYGSGMLPEERGEMVWLTLEKPHAGSFSLPGFGKTAAKEWWKVMTGPSQLRFGIPPALKSLVAKLVAMDASDRSHPTRTEYDLTFGLFLVELQRVIGSGADAHISSGIRKALHWLEKRLEDDPPAVAELAAASGLSESHFHRRFKREIGVSPADFILRRKILEAQRRLRAGKSVTTAAMELGFSSSQYFATVFKRYTRVTPTEWLASADRRGMGDV